MGRNLRLLQVGLSSAVRLPGMLSKGSVAGTYIYSFVEKPISDISVNRTNGFLDFGYAVIAACMSAGAATGSGHTAVCA